MVSKVTDSSEYEATLLKQVEQLVATISAASAKELRGVMTACAARSVDPNVLRSDRAIYERLGKMLRSAVS
jgi:hypothetical protein